jgi:hypothetical protein
MSLQKKAKAYGTKGSPNEMTAAPGLHVISVDSILHTIHAYHAHGSAYGPKNS